MIECKRTPAPSYDMPSNRQIIKRIVVVEQKVVERIVQIPKIVEIEKIIERIIPIEVEKIVEIPIIIEVLVEKEVEILKIVETHSSCCCGQKEEAHQDQVQVDKLIEELASVKKTLEDMVKGCSEQVSFFRESKEIIELENQQLRINVIDLQKTIVELQQQMRQLNGLEIRQETMEISRSISPSLCLSQATLEQCQFTIPSEVSQTPIFSKKVQTDQSLFEISMNHQIESPARQPTWRPFCTLKQFANGQNYDEGILLLLVIKLVQQIELDFRRGLLSFHTPSTITIGYDNFGNVQVSLGDPIDIHQILSQTYLPPETIKGGEITEKSCVFNIGTVWDELLHSTTYFRCTRDIVNMANQYKVRNKNLNPLLASVLYSTMCKSVKQRPTLKQTLRLLKNALMHLNQVKDSSSNGQFSDRTFE